MHAGVFQSLRWPGTLTLTTWLAAFKLSAEVWVRAADAADSGPGGVEFDGPDDRDSDERSLLQVKLGTANRAHFGGMDSGRSYHQNLTNTEDLQYTGLVRLGNQELAAVLDTGSFEVVVFSTDCSSCGLAGSRGYSHRTSPSYHSGRLVKTHTYGSGAAMSFDGVDAFSVGSFSVSNMDFWEAMDADMPVLQSATFQAIVGLGPPGEPQIAAQEMKDRSQSLLRQSNLDPSSREHAQQDLQIAELVLAKQDNVLAGTGIRYLSVCLEWSSGAPGHLIWNDTAPGMQQVSFHELPVISRTTWSVNLTRARFAGPEGVIELGCLGGCEAVMDTGTSLIAVPSHVYRKATDALQRLDADCSNLHEMPDLIVSLGDHDYSLPPQSYVGVIAGTRPLDPQGWIHENGAQTRMCELLLLDGGDGTSSLGPQWILGMPFYRYFYTTFDLGSSPLNASSRKVWTAIAGENCQPSSAAEHRLKLSHARKQPIWTINGTHIRVPRMRKLGSGLAPNTRAEESYSWRVSEQAEESIALRLGNQPPIHGLSAPRPQPA